MKNKSLVQIGIAVAVVVVIGIVLYFTLGNPTVDTSQVTAGVAYGINNETEAVATSNLSSEDLDIVAGIFNGKEKKSASPGDIFSEKCAFVLSDGDSDQYFFVALDGSNNICSANDNMYFQVNDEEMEQLADILHDYCGYKR